MKFNRFCTIILLAFFSIPFGLFGQGQKPVDPVNWRELVSFLIEIPDWEAEGDPEGSSISMEGFKLSQAERDYTADDKDLNIKIIDGGYVPMVYAGIKMAMSFDLDTSERYVKKVTIKGFPGVEQYDYGDKKAEVMILVSDRFLFHLIGENFENTSKLVEISNLLDLEGVANLAKKK